MSRPVILDQMRKRISSASDGTVFIPADFSDLADQKKITACISRLYDEGSLEKVKRGVYMKPRYSSFLRQKVPADGESVSEAIARNYGWTIAPSGDTALNVLGLSTQVPAVYQYVSDGPYKEYEADGIKYLFKHTDRKNELIGLSGKSAVLIQALRALGKEHIGEEEILYLKNRFTNEEKAIILIETKYVTSWIYEIIKEICKEEKL